jgi:phospholipase/lecithinase/hemolysin
MSTPAVTVRGIASIVIACGLSVVSAAAGQFSSMIVFGDSLSDVGNIAQATLGIYPGPYYHNNRFSNGPVWVEALSVDLGFGLIQRSTADGSDFAFGGAQTTGTGGFNGIFIRDVDEQVSQYLSTHTVDPGSLFVVYAGANDFLGGQTNVNVPLNSLVNDISRLVVAGARQFLVPNLPLLGFTPRFNNNPTLAAQLNAMSTQFNAGLDMALDALAAGNLELTFFRLDVADVFADAVADAAAFGLSNVEDSAAPGLEPGASTYNTSQIAANADQYLFWDEVHPTASVHAVLAERARVLLLGRLGDFNNDGTIDAADYVVWRKNDGTQESYDAWRANFGTSLGVGSGSVLPSAEPLSAAAPEPATVILMILAAVGWSLCRRRDA